jgi:hypothetical protein
MAITLFPFTNDFAAEIGDIDLHHSLAADDLQGVRDALARYAVLFFPAQDLSAEQHMAFAAHFGPLERSLQVTMSRGQPLRLREEVADIANLDANGQLWQKDSRMRVFQMMANRLWHTDSSFNAPGAMCRCCMHARCRRLAATRSLPTCARPTIRRCTMHHGTEFDDMRWRRDMQRVTTSDRIEAFGSAETPATVTADY